MTADMILDAEGVRIEGALRLRILKSMERCASLQIEKDRERLRQKFNIEIGHKHGYEVYGDIAQCIHETPIQLD